MINLKLYTVKERQPENGETILLFGTKESFQSCYEIQFVTVEYYWTILDEQGRETGTQCVFEGFSNKPEGNVKLLLLADDNELKDEDVYATLADLEHAYELLNIQF